MNQYEIGKINGYLEAVSSLKDDGTGFLFDFIGKGLENDIPKLLSNYFPKNSHLMVIKPVENWVRSVVPELKYWLLTRRQIINENDSEDLDPRLYDGFIEELLNCLDNPIQWYEVVQNIEGQRVMTTNEAIWHCFVISIPAGNYILHCGWDS